MLIGVVFLPVLVGFIFRFAVPFIDKNLIETYFGHLILIKYYRIFDLFLALITPYFFCFVSALVMLSEYDENLVGYLAVTPVGKKGYIVSRLAIPALLSLPFSFLLMKIFSLSSWNPFLQLLVCVVSSLMSIAIALVVFSFSSNRVEGLALGKLANIFTLGIFVPFFIEDPIQYAFSFLPSFWIAKSAIENNFGNMVCFLPALVVSIIWIGLLCLRLERKLQR
jgi:fluoroquinolone transport system permease protein